MKGMGIRFECQCCGHEVQQPVDARGLPDRPPPCMWCAQAADAAATILRQKREIETGAGYANS